LSGVISQFISFKVALDKRTFVQLLLLLPVELMMHGRRLLEIPPGLPEQAGDFLANRAA